MSRESCYFHCCTRYYMYAVFCFAQQEPSVFRFYEQGPRYHHDMMISSSCRNSDNTKDHAHVL
eukprot:1159753-Pelagomonas_calceolata.AAC.5